MEREEWEQTRLIIEAAREYERKTPVRVTDPEGNTVYREAESDARKERYIWKGADTAKEWIAEALRIKGIWESYKRRGVRHVVIDNTTAPEKGIYIAWADITAGTDYTMLSVKKEGEENDRELILHIKSDGEGTLIMESEQFCEEATLKEILDLIERSGARTDRFGEMKTGIIIRK